MAFMRSMVTGLSKNRLGGKSLLTIINHILTWCVFAGFMVVAWDAAMASSITRLKMDTGTMFGPGGEGVRRPYLIALSAYSVAVAWSWIAILALLMYAGITVIMCMAPFGPEFAAEAIGVLLAPDLLLHCIDAAHIPFHAAVAVATVLSAAAATGFYVTEIDLEEESSVRSKAVRLLFIAPMVMTVAYGIYILSCIVF